MGAEEFEQINERLERIEKMSLLAAKKVLMLDDVKLITGLSKSHLYKLTSAKKIPHYKPDGKLIYFNKSEIEEWMLQNRITPNYETERLATTYLTYNRR